MLYSLFFASTCEDVYFIRDTLLFCFTKQFVEKGAIVTKENSTDKKLFIVFEGQFTLFRDNSSLSILT